MKKLCASLCMAAVAAMTSSALARPVGAIDSLAVAPYWYADYFGSNLNINGVNHSNGLGFTAPLSPLHITDDTFPVGGGFTDRHHAALAAGGSPYLFQPGNSFQFDVDVTINSTLDAHTEAGIWFGNAPSYPSSAGANTGNFVLLPDNGGEIAAFGGVMPFFSNNQAENSGMARATRGSVFHMTMIYSAVFGQMTYGVNGVFTSAFDVQYFGAPGFQPNSMLGVYEQGPNNTSPTSSTQVDVLFSNLVITAPAPGSAALLGLGGLLAARRRR